MSKRVAIGRMLINGHLRIEVAIDGLRFWADIPVAAIEQLGLMDACRRGRKALHQMALQRRLKMLEAPSPSRMVH